MVFYSEIKGNKRRKFLYKQGNFFIFYGGFGISKFTICLGPDGLVFLLLVAFALFIMISGYMSEGYQVASMIVKLFYLISNAVLLLLLLHTGMTDPGVIIANEKNSIQNSSDLEKQNYSYCSICQLYRPKGAFHCDRCNVCIEGYDHHCIFMGQCIGKKTKYSFYGMVIAVFICYVSHLLVKSPFIVMYFKSILIVWKRIFSIFSL